MKKYILFIFFIFYSSQFVYSADINGYVGGNLGQASIDTGVSGTTGTADLDEEDLGWKIYGGANLNEYLAIEVQYADFGEATLSGNVNDTFVIDNTTLQFLTTAELILDGDSFGFSGVAGYDINEHIRPYARLGGHQWDASFSVAAGGLSATIADDDGFDIFYGFGVKIKISEQLSAVAEYENYGFDDEDVELFTAGIQLTF